MLVIQVFGGAVRGLGTSRHRQLLEDCKDLKVYPCACVGSPSLSVSLCVYICVCVHMWVCRVLHFECICPGDRLFCPH